MTKKKPANAPNTKGQDRADKRFVADDFGKMVIKPKKNKK